MNIGTAIRSIRKELNIPQKQLAVDCGISQTFLSGIENGARRPSPKTMQRICTVMDIPEMLVYIMAMHEKDVPTSKRHVYSLVYPSIVHLAMQMVSTDHADMVKRKDIREK